MIKFSQIRFTPKEPVIAYGKVGADDHYLLPGLPTLKMNTVIDWKASKSTLETGRKYAVEIFGADSKL